MKVFSSERFSIPLPKNHKFPMKKYKRLRNLVKNDGRFELIEAYPIDLEVLTSVHDKDYVMKVMKGDLSRCETQELGFPWSANLVDRSLYSVGSTLATVRAAVEDKAACSLAGGTHHAAYDYGSGFCVFNDIAVACFAILKQYPELNIVVIDTDVHQGDGTAMMLSDSPRVTTVSIHANSNFPPRKRCSDLDIFLPNLIADTEYLEIFQETLFDILHTKRPELIIFVSGADIYKGDRLGRLSISKKTIERRDQLLFKQAAKFSSNVATLMGGGYANDIKDIVDIHFNTVIQAYKFWCS